MLNFKPFKRMKRFDTYQLTLKLSAFIQNAVPGLSKVFFFWEDAEGLNSLENSMNEPPVYLVCDDGIKNQLEPFIKQKNPWSWLSDSDLPYETTKSIRLQRTVFSEENNTVLFLCPAFARPSVKILIFIHFDSGFHWHGRDRSQQALTTDHKSLVSFLLYHITSNYLSEKSVEEENHIKMVQAVESLAAHLRTTVIENKQKQDAVDQWKTETIHFFAEEYSQTSSHRIFLDASAISYLGNSSYHPAEIKRILGLAIDLAQLTHPNIDSEIVVSDYHIIATMNQKAVDFSKDTRQGAVADRTMALLDRLELAAAKTIENGEEISGQRLARNCSPPISPPAISDALKKHRPRISQLLIKYPNRWLILRSRFKPIQNQLKSRETGSAQTA